MPKERILVVEDDTVTVVLLRDILEFKGYQIHVAHDGIEGLAMVQKCKPHLIVLDVMMPKMDGYEVCRRLKTDPSTARIPILMLTAKGQVVDKVQGYKIGADLYLPKPCDKEELEAAVESLLRRSPRHFLVPDPSTTCTLSVTCQDKRQIHVQLKGADTFACDTANHLHLDVAVYSRHTKDAYGADDWRFQVKDTGRRLYQTLFTQHSEMVECYNRGLGKVGGRDDRLKLVFRSSREFLQVPLEFLLDDPEHFALRHPMARFILNTHTPRSPISPAMLNAMMDRAEPLRMLLIASNTPPRIDGVDAEVTHLKTLLQKGLSDCPLLIEVECIRSEEATYKRIEQELRRCRYHIVHYAGHGYYSKESSEESSLFFWEELGCSGKVRKMTAAELSLLLRGSETTFVYLSCCLGAKTGPAEHLLDDNFLGIADALVQAGVPSVLGFRWPVSDVGAKELAQAFYRSLCAQGDVDVALLEGRCRVARRRADKTWISPVLVRQG